MGASRPLVYGPVWSVIDGYEDLVTRLLAETERLRAALRPLAELYETDPEWVEEECLEDMRRIATALGPIRFNDVKRAWEALRLGSGDTP